MMYTQINILDLKNMTKNTKIIITLGVLTVIMPFLGFPGGVRDTFFVFAGIIIAVLTYITNKFSTIENTKKETEEDHAPTFEENKEEFIEQKKEKDEQSKKESKEDIEK